MKRIILLLPGLLCVLLSGCNNIANINIQPQIANTIEMKEGTLFTLDGTWEFLPGQGEGEGAWETIDVPSIWKGKIIEGSYHLLLKLENLCRSDSPALYIPKCYTAYTIQINEAQFANGKIEPYIPSQRPRVFQLPNTDMVDITIKVKDTQTTFGGINSSVYFGYSEDIQQHIFNRILLDSICIGALLYAAILYLCIWFLENKKLRYFSLAVAAIAFIFRILLVYNQHISPFTQNFRFIELVGTITTPIIAISFAIYMSSYIPYKYFQIDIRAAVITNTLYILFVLFSPTIIVYRYSIIYAVSLQIEVLVGIIAYFHLLKEKRQYASLIWLLVLIIFFAMLVLSSLFWSGINANVVLPLFSVAFLVQAIHFAIQFNRSNKRSRSLNKQKDTFFAKVSHSLKTPLYGLVGSFEAIAGAKSKETAYTEMQPTIESSINDLSSQIDKLLSITEYEFSDSKHSTQITLGNEKQTIMIIDDKKMNRDIFSTQLKAIIQECSVLTVGSGREALNILKHTSVNIVFCDYLMPEMNGIEFTEECRKAEFSFPIYLFSASFFEQHRVNAKKAGANGFLKKPITVKELKEIIEVSVTVKE